MKQNKVNISGGFGLVNLMIGLGVSSIVALGVMSQSKALYRAKQDIGTLQEVEMLKQVLPVRIDCAATIAQCVYDPNTLVPQNPLVNLLGRKPLPPDPTAPFPVLLASMEPQGHTSADTQPGLKLKESTVVARCLQDGVRLYYRDRIVGDRFKNIKWFELMSSPICVRPTNVGSTSSNNEAVAQNQDLYSMITVLNEVNGRPTKEISFTATKSMMAITLSGTLRTKDDNGQCRVYAYVLEGSKVVWGDRSLQGTPIAVLRSHDNGQKSRLGFSRRMNFVTTPNEKYKLVIQSFSKNASKNCWSEAQTAGIYLEVENYDY